MSYIEHVEVWTSKPVPIHIAVGVLRLGKWGIPELEVLGKTPLYAGPLTLPNVWTLLPKKGETRGLLLQGWEHIRAMSETVKEQEIAALTATKKERE